MEARGRHIGSLAPISLMNRPAQRRETEEALQKHVLLGFFNSEEAWTSARWHPVSRKLKDKDLVFIQSQDGEKIPLGSIFALDSYKLLFGFQANWILKKKDIDRFVADSFFIFDTLVKEKPRFAERLRSVMHEKSKLFIGREKIADLNPAGFYPRVSNDRLLRVSPEPDAVRFLFQGRRRRLRHSDLPSEFNALLKYRFADGRSFTTRPSPAVFCRKSPVQIHLKNLDIAPVAR